MNSDHTSSTTPAPTRPVGAHRLPAAAHVELVSPDALDSPVWRHEAPNGRHALVVGDIDDGAVAYVGYPAELEQFAARLLQRVQPAVGGGEQDSDDGRYTARDHLFTMIRSGLRQSMVCYAGHDRGGAYTNRDAWRHADLGSLVDHVMTTLRAGLSPHLEAQAVEDAVRTAHRLLTSQPPTDVVRLRRLAAELTKNPWDKNLAALLAAAADLRETAQGQTFAALHQLLAAVDVIATDLEATVSSSVPRGDPAGACDDCGAAPGEKCREYGCPGGTD